MNLLFCHHRFLEVGTLLMDIVKMVPELHMVVEQILNVGIQSMELATLILQTVEGERQSINNSRLSQLKQDVFIVRFVEVNLRFIETTIAPSSKVKHCQA